MSYSGLVLGIAIFLNIVYFGVSLKAFQYVKPEEKNKKSYFLFATDIWWPFYMEAFEVEGRAYCKYGIVLFLLTISSYVVWAVLRYT